MSAYSEKTDSFEPFQNFNTKELNASIANTQPGQNFANTVSSAAVSDQTNSYALENTGSPANIPLKVGIGALALLMLLLLCKIVLIFLQMHKSK